MVGQEGERSSRYGCQAAMCARTGPGKVGRKPPGHHPLKPASISDASAKVCTRRPLKYNENRVFRSQMGPNRWKRERFFRHLRVKFVTWPINEIFCPINELKLPLQPNNSGNLAAWRNSENARARHRSIGTPESGRRLTERRIPRRWRSHRLRVDLPSM